ncbi:hypothetical protein [Falsiruegeria mediterranea]|uniref:hypothetical protein n=1 Tax=Falsiruegeria mediterranea TaxID=1280832 RepID=UPI0015F2528D|nr:hypothetical protein [Falsiruegeria mediterranea]
MIGSVPLKLGSKKTHKLKLSTRAQYRLEQEFDGQPIDKVLQAFLDGSKGVGMVLAMIKACANDGAGFHDPSKADDDGPSAEDQALELVESAGGPSAVVPVLSKAVAAAFPQSDTPDEGGDEGNGTASPSD